MNRCASHITKVIVETTIFFQCSNQQTANTTAENALTSVCPPLIAECLPYN